MIDLFRSENVVVRSMPTKDVSRWIVTFDNYGIGHGFDRPGFGQEFLRQSGVSALHVMGCQEDWYQYPEMAEAMAAARAATVGADRVMTYGSSMGGYAAIRFADAVRAHAVLALSPQYSIDPQKMPSETRWLQDSHRITWLPEVDGRIICRARPVVVFDPLEDGHQVTRIQGDIDIRQVALPYVSHPATTYLAETGLLKPLVLQALSGDFEHIAFGREARRRRGASSFYLSNLAMRQPAHRRGLALDLAQRAVKIGPSSPLASLALARLLSAEGRHDDAIKRLEGIVTSTKRAPVYLISYVDALVAAGRFDEARPYAREAVEALSHQAHLHAWEGALLQRLGEAREAVEAVERAIALDPRPQYFQLLETYRDDAEANGLSQRNAAGRASRMLARLGTAIRGVRKA